MGVLGERWSVLIIREALRGRTRFSEFRSELGIAPDVLSARLASLVAAGVFEQVEYQEVGDRRRQAYELTEAGHALSTVMASLAQWGYSYLPRAADNGYRFVDSATQEPVLAGLRRRGGEIADPAGVALVRKGQ